MSCIPKFYILWKCDLYTGTSVIAFDIQVMSAAALEGLTYFRLRNRSGWSLQVQRVFSSALLLLGLWPGFVDGSLHLVISVGVYLLQHAHQAVAGVCSLLRGGFPVEKFIHHVTTPTNVSLAAADASAHIHLMNQSLEHAVVLTSIKIPD